MPLTEGYAKLKSKAEKIVDSVKASKFLSQKKETPLPYAYPCDNYMDAILSNGLVRKTLQLFADKYCKEQIQNIKSTGQFVNRSNYPHLYDVLQSCYKALNVEDIPEVYITNRLKGINALSVGTDNAPVILISRMAVINLSEGELKFMIGHELGHILQKNLICHTVKGILDNLNKKSEILGPIVSDMIEVPLNQWCRCAEYTADRAGLICCGNMDQVYKIMNRVKSSEGQSLAPVLMELYKGHPFVNKRIDELNKFFIVEF